MSLTLGIAIVGVVLVVFLFVILFVFPTDVQEQKRKRKSRAEITLKQEASVDYKPAIEKLEHHIHALHQQIAGFEKKQRDSDKELLVEQAKVKKLQEKINQERGWHEKEQEVIDKRNKELKDLQSELKNTQESYAKEHTLNLKLQHDLKDLQQVLESTNQLRRQAESNDAQLKATVESYRRDVAQLKAENIELKKKKDDTTWIAKSEYERVEKLLREKEKEFERLERELREKG